jgi:hypothetical protein
MWFCWSGLGEILEFEGLDNMDLPEFLRGGVRKKDQGLKHIDSIWLIHGAEAPAPSGEQTRARARTGKGKGKYGDSGAPE